MPAADFYYDVVCPYAYLASTQVPALEARCGVQLTFRPMLLGGVFRAIGSADRPGDHMSPAKARHNALDMRRWADHFGVSLSMPDEHPRRTVLAMRAIIAAEQLAEQLAGPGEAQAVQRRAAAALFAAYWSHGADVTRPEVVAGALTAAGLAGESIVARADTAPVKDALFAATERAVQAGVFGAPAFVIDGSLYWGQDRMTLVEAHLRGTAPWLSKEVAHS